MGFLRRRKPSAVVLILAVIAARAGIPAGYMPAMPGSGLLVELCPSAVPAGVMQVLTERRSGGHHHAHHGHDRHGAAGSEPADHMMHEGDSCPLGHLLFSALAVDTSPAAQSLPPALDVIDAPTVVYARTIRSATSSRGPPA